MDINLQNRKKYAEYARLLWNFAYSANHLRDNDKKQLSVYPLINSCFSEFYTIQAINNPWEFDWENTDFDTLVHVGDYFCHKIVDNTAPRNIQYQLIHVVDIQESKTLTDEMTKSVYFQTITLNKSSFVIYGENISNNPFYNYNRSMFIKPFCAYIFDGIYKKVDESVWTEIMDMANNVSDKYEKLKEIWK